MRRRAGGGTLPLPRVLDLHKEKAVLIHDVCHPINDEEPCVTERRIARHRSRLCFLARRCATARSVLPRARGLHCPYSSAMERPNGMKGGRSERAGGKEQRRLPPLRPRQKSPAHFRTHSFPPQVPIPQTTCAARKRRKKDRAKV